MMVCVVYRLTLMLLCDDVWIVCRFLFFDKYIEQLDLEMILCKQSISKKRNQYLAKCMQFRLHS